MCVCIAIINNGPRRGQMCGRACSGNRVYCDRYHWSMYSNKSISYGSIEDPPTNLKQQKESFTQLVGTHYTIYRLCCFLSIRPTEHKLPCKIYTEDCSICTTQARKDEVWVETPCDHCFHVDCIKDWIDTFTGLDKGCPLCRSPIRRKIKKGFIVQ